MNPEEEKALKLIQQLVVEQIDQAHEKRLSTQSLTLLFNFINELLAKKKSV